MAESPAPAARLAAALAAVLVSLPRSLALQLLILLSLLALGMGWLDPCLALWRAHDWQHGVPVVRLQAMPCGCDLRGVDLHGADLSAGSGG